MEKCICISVIKKVGLRVYLLSLILIDLFKVVLEKNKDKMAPLDWSPSMRLSTWADMVANVGPEGSGKPVRAAGVCNFSERQLQELLLYCRENNLPKPAVVQNECHHLLQVFLIIGTLADC